MSKLTLFPSLILSFFLPLLGYADQVLVLSGGGSPSGNHHSQYLQTKTLTDQLREEFPRIPVDVLFAAGNNLEQNKILPDVHSLVREGNLKLNKMIYGVIEGNHPATLENVEGYFNTTDFSPLQPDDTFFLMVSDHGMPNHNDPERLNNCIDLWSIDVDPSYGAFTSRDWEKKCLSVNSLGSLLKQVPTKKKVFAMSQCYSGGFHRLSVQTEAYPSADIHTCGFTAITEDSVASGCTPDVDGPGYKGYERFFTQQLTGVDVVTGKSLSSGPHWTPWEAHHAAALQDSTLDIPTTTLDFYLQEWAKTIQRPEFSPRSGKKSVVHLQRLFQKVANQEVDPLDSLRADSWLHQIGLQRIRFAEDTARFLSENDPEIASILMDGTIENLKEEERKISNRLKAIDSQEEALGKEYTDIRFEKIFPHWKSAVENRQVDLGESQELEVSFFLSMLSRYVGESGVFGEISRMAISVLSLATQTKTPEKVDRVTRYMANRDEMIMNWAKNQGGEMANAVGELERIDSEVSALDAEYDPLKKRLSYFRRVRRQREQMAALVILREMNDLRALREVKGLQSCLKTKIK